MKFAIVSSRFDEKSGGALDGLRESCFEKLRAEKVEFAEFRVPGAFEIPTLAKKILVSKKFDGVIALGVVVRGETAHFDFVAGNCARKLADLGVEFSLPVIFGVLTTSSSEQAVARQNLGADFASAAIEMKRELDKI